MMKELYPLFGIVTVLNTPFTQNNELDLHSLRRNVRKALQAGVAGFLVPAMASEVYKLSVDERLRMVDAVLEEVNGRVPVIAGAGETDMERARQLLKLYIDRGCRNVLFQIPFRDEGLFIDQFMYLAHVDPAMIMLQDWDAGGYGLPDELICRLFEEVPAFRCLKVETIPAGIKYSRILQLTNGRLHVSGGWAVSQMIEGLKRGVHAFMPTGMHFTYAKIYREYAAGNHEKAQQLFSQLLPVLAFSNQHLDISIHFFKHLLHRQGLYATPQVRQPILEFDAVHDSMASPLIDAVIALENSIEHSLTN
ncbi:MAG: dihydrodipicolinate synthase family protein [Chitinophagaceae bacterium]